MARDGHSALDDTQIDGLFYAVIGPTERAVLNAMLAADTMVGRDEITAHALPSDRLLELLGRRRRDESAD